MRLDFYTSFVQIYSLFIHIYKQYIYDYKFIYVLKESYYCYNYQTFYIVLNESLSIGCIAGAIVSEQRL